MGGRGTNTEGEGSCGLTGELPLLAFYKLHFRVAKIKLILASCPNCSPACVNRSEKCQKADKEITRRNGELGGRSIWRGGVFTMNTVRLSSHSLGVCLCHLGAPAKMQVQDASLSTQASAQQLRLTNTRAKMMRTG